MGWNAVEFAADPLADGVPPGSHFYFVHSYYCDPAPGVAVPRGSTVALTVSEGPPRVAVPDVRGLDADLAQRLLAAAGIAVASVDTVAGVLPEGLAAGTAPAARDSVAAGSAVILHLSRGSK
jgi:serine/threonine-protein kinase